MKNDTLLGFFFILMLVNLLVLGAMGWLIAYLWNLYGVNLTPHPIHLQWWQAALGLVCVRAVINYIKA